MAFALLFTAYWVIGALTLVCIKVMDRHPEIATSLAVVAVILGSVTVSLVAQP